MAKSTEIAVVDELENALAVSPDADLMNISIADLAQSDQYRIPGWDLVSDKDMLMGVPFFIVGVTFQMPVADKARPSGSRDYVSCRAIVGNQEMLDEAEERGWIPGKLAFKPEERILFNDGSTGIRRDIVKILDTAGLIKVGHEDIPGMGRYDLPWTEWESFSQSAQQGENVVPEFITNHRGNLFTIQARRGVRRSDYTNEYGDSDMATPERRPRRSTLAFRLPGGSPPSIRQSRSPSF